MFIRPASSADIDFMVSRNPDNRVMTVSSKSSDACQVCEKILAEITAENYSQDDIFGIHLALEEAFINAITHGNKQDADKKIHIEYQITPEKVEITVTDQGKGFDMNSLPDPRCGDNIYKTSGRGVLLIRSYMDVVEYNDTGNCVKMIKYRTAAGSQKKTK